MWVKNSFKVEVERHKSNLKNEKLILVQHENVKKIFFFFLVFLQLHPWHMEVPRLGVLSELQLPAYTMATVTPDLSQVCDLHHSSWQGQFPDPLSEARDRIHILMDASQVCHR